jgi:hypothetical protein
MTCTQPPTPAEVLAAYEKLKLVPIQGEYIMDDSKSCCALTALTMVRPDYDSLLAKFEEENPHHANYDLGEMMDEITDELGFHPGDKVAFIKGFDAEGLKPFDIPEDTELAMRQRAFYEAGKACWDAVKHLANEGDQE